MLQTERNPNDGDTQENAKTQVRKTNPDASQKYPQHIHQHIQASAGTFAAPHRLSERPQRKHGKFQRLYAERNADDSNHHQQTGHKILHGSENTPKYQPQKVH